jgi:nucleoporin NUP42
MDPSKKLVSYRGRRVQYINGNPCYERSDGKGWERIWFPDGGAGPDVVALNNAEKLEEVQGKGEDYTDAIREEFKFLFEEGRFRNGKMPLVPPMREWCIYDF